MSTLLEPIVSALGSTWRRAIIRKQHECCKCGVVLQPRKVGYVPTLGNTEPTRRLCTMCLTRGAI